MLGRDCRENGKVEYTRPEAKQQPLAIANLEPLEAMANDPDAGVRRELILAFRNLPTDQIGDSAAKAGRGVGRARPLVPRGPGIGAGEA